VGQDINTGYPTLREAIQRSSPTLVRLSQLTEPNRIYGTEEREPGKRKIGWAQAIYLFQARLQELKSIYLLPEKWDDTLEDELAELETGKQAFLYTRPKLIQAGYTTLDSIPRIQKGSRTRFYCPALKGIDSKTQDTVSTWIQLFNKHPAHLHALDIKDARKQRDPGIKPLEGMTTSKLADKYTVKRNKIRNQCTLLHGQVEEGVVFFLDKVEETTSACDNLLLTWKTQGSPQGDRKVKEIMYSTASRILTETEQWRDNSSMEDTLNSLTLIQTFLEEIREMNLVILKEEEETASEFPSILRLLIKKISLAGEKTQIQQWWYDTMTLCPPPLPKHEEKHREEILDRVEEGWHEADWAITMPQMIHEIMQKYSTSIRNLTVARTSYATEGIQWI